MWKVSMSFSILMQWLVKTCLWQGLWLINCNLLFKVCNWHRIVTFSDVKLKWIYDNFIFFEFDNSRERGERQTEKGREREAKCIVNDEFDFMDIEILGPEKFSSCCQLKPTRKDNCLNMTRPGTSCYKKWIHSICWIILLRPHYHDQGILQGLIVVNLLTNIGLCQTIRSNEYNIKIMIQQILSLNVSHESL